MKKILIIILLLALMSTAVFANDNIDGKTIEKSVEVEKDYIYRLNNTYFNVDFIKELLNNNYEILPLLNDEKMEIILEKNNQNSTISFEGIKEVPLDEIIKVTYSDEIEIPLPKENLNADSIFILDSNNKEVTDISYKREHGSLIINKTYYLNLGETYTIKGFKENKVFEQKIQIKSFLTRESFKAPDTGGNYKSVTVPAQPKKGFYFPYRLMYSTFRVVNSFGDIKEESFDTTKDILYLESTNHGIDYSLDEMIVRANNAYNSGLSMDIMHATKYNGFAMVGFFPRLRDEGGIYTHALDRQTMFGTKQWWDKIDRGNLYRIDKQFIAMQKDARMQLATMGRNVGQPILAGFSASSDFVSRINYLYPDLARAVIINDPKTVPLEKYNGVELKYPLGMADLEELTGKPFNKEKFLDTPQFWTTGSRDRNDSTVFSDGWGSYTLDKPSYSSNIDRNQEGIDYRKAFGNNVIQRRENIRNILKEKGFTNIEMHTYDIGHHIDNDILKDVEKFLDRIIK